MWRWIKRMLALLIPGVGMRGGSDTAVPPTRYKLGASRRVGFGLYARRNNTKTLIASDTTTVKLRAATRMSITSNLTWFRGEDITLDFQMSPPEDITSWTLSFKVADTVGGTVQFTKTPTITSGPLGRFRVTIASADTSGLAVGRYVWDCRRTDSGNKATLADGYIDLKREVTA